MNKTVTLIITIILIRTILTLKEPSQETSDSPYQIFLPFIRQTFAITLVSVTSDGTQSNLDSYEPVISANGQYIAFVSSSTNLVINDANGSYPDIFIYDQQTKNLKLLSVASDGTQGNLGSNTPVISADGRYVAFYSEADNLVPNDTNGQGDIFVHDSQTGQTSRVSIASDGNEANNFSYTPSISADGRYVAFASLATNLVNNDTNNEPDVFLHDRQTGYTSRISISSNGIEGNLISEWTSISGDGRYVVFQSYATNLVSDDTNNLPDIFIHDRQTHQTGRVSVAFDGSEANGGSNTPAISSDGRFVVFSSLATNLVNKEVYNTSNIFVRNLLAEQTRLISVSSDRVAGNDDSNRPVISSNGRYVAFYSFANNLVIGDTNNFADIFIHDCKISKTTRISLAADGTETNAGSYSASISLNGQYITFGSYASNIVGWDTNLMADVFVYDREILDGY